MSTTNNISEEPEENQGFLDGKLGGFEETWSESTWTEIDQVLHPKRKRFFIWWMFCAVLAGLGLYLASENNPEEMARNGNPKPQLLQTLPSESGKSVKNNPAMNAQPNQNRVNPTENRSVDFEKRSEQDKKMGGSKPEENPPSGTRIGFTASSSDLNRRPSVKKPKKEPYQKWKEKENQANAYPSESFLVLAKKSEASSKTPGKSEEKERTLIETEKINRATRKQLETTPETDEMTVNQENKTQDPGLEKLDKNAPLQALPIKEITDQNPAGVAPVTEMMAEETVSDLQSEAIGKEKLDSTATHKHILALSPLDPADTSSKKTERKTKKTKGWSYSPGLGYGFVFQRVKSTEGLLIQKEGYWIFPSEIKQSSVAQLSFVLSKPIFPGIEFQISGEIQFWKQELSLERRASPSVPMVYSYNENLHQLEIRPRESSQSATISRNVFQSSLSIGLEYQTKKQFGIRIRSGPVQSGFPTSNQDGIYRYLTLGWSGGVFKRWGNQIETGIEFSQFDFSGSALPLFEGSSSGIQIISLKGRYWW